MALLNRLFPTKRKARKQGYVPCGRNELSGWKPFNFSREQVRLLLFRECDSRGRKLLFDSSAVQKTSIESNQSSRMKLVLKSKCDTTKKTEAYVEVTNGYGYQYTRPSSDVTLMGEMIFGSVAMTYKGMSCKIHSMKSPDRFMCSRVFFAPAIHLNCKRRSNQSIDSSGSSVSSINDSLFSQSGNYESKLGSSSGSGPLDVPVTSNSRKGPTNSLEGDSGFCGDASLHSASSVGSGFWSPYPYQCDSQNGCHPSSGSISNSGGSLASLQRRWMRNISTSLEFGVTSSHWYLKGKTASGLVDDNFCRPHRKTQLGLTVVISLTEEEEKEMEIFLFEHVAIIESILERLQNNIERAYIKKEVFVHSMMDAFVELQQWLCDLFTAPRLSTPVWMSLVSTSEFYRESSRFRYNIASSFLRDFCHLIASLDTKDTNFFISTLVTAVLTHHLGWVATILPTKAPPSSVTKTPCTVQILHALAKSNPYNALWAQLGDLHGALGNPVKIARTVVTANAKKSDLLNKLLYCLSYFIRCGNIEKRIDNQIAIDNEFNVVDSVIESLSSVSLNSSTASSSTIVPDDSICMEKQEKDIASSDCRVFPNPQRTLSTYSKTKVMSGKSMDNGNAVSKNDVFHGPSGFKKSPTLGGNLHSLTGVTDSVTNNLQTLHDSYLHPDVISDKVNRLCRVPSNAVQYHMKSRSSVPPVEALMPQRIVCEKQMTSVENPNNRVEMTVKSRKESEYCFQAAEIRRNKDNKSGVIFVLGDSDELVDLKSQNGFSIAKSKSDNTLSCESVGLINSYSDKTNSLKHISRSSCTLPLRPEVSAEIQADINEDISLKIPENVCSKFDRSVQCEKYFLNSEETALDSGIVLEEDNPSVKFQSSSSRCVSDSGSLWKNERTNKENNKNCSLDVCPSSLLKDVNGNPRLDVNVSDRESKVVTSHSFVIELEDVHGSMRKKIPTIHRRLSKQVCRSQSLSFPDTKSPSSRSAVSICRRHSDLNERYLRDYHSVRFNFERCDGILSDYVDGIGVEKSPQNEKKSMKLFEARGNFQMQDKMCERCKHREQEIASNSVLCSSGTCSCTKGNAPKNNTCHNIGRKNVERHAERREGNALFDDYGLLSDEELLSSTEVHDESSCSTETVQQQQQQQLQQQPLLCELPLPRYNYSQREQMSGFAASLLGGVSDHYMPDMVLHGCTQMLPSWEAILKRDLSVSAHHPTLDQDVAEAVCIVANADLWEVQLVSSQISVSDKPGGFGIHIGMSQLVANMLESLLHLWKLRTPPEQCLQHLESKLRELCLRSQAVAELLLTTEFCDLATLTSSLGLEANDVPLLLAVASTHTPQVTSHYGLSFH